MEDGVAGRRVLVTGGGGFLGRVVCSQLRRAGAAQLTVPRRADCDLTDRGAVDRLLRARRPQTLVHLAAEVGGIGANRANPGRYFFANAAMGLNLIDAAREFGVRKFVLVGTVCSYPRVTRVPFREEDLWGGYPEETNAPYGIAKKALIVMLGAYRAQYGLTGISLLPTNLYGPGDDFRPDTSHVIPALIRKFEGARRRRLPSVTCWGTGEASRDFLYVDDCARAVARAARMYDGAEPVNLGSGRETRIRELAERIRALTGFRGDIEWDRAQPDGQPRRHLDVTRAERLLGFRARVSLEEGLARTLSWYRYGLPRAPTGAARGASAVPDLGG